MHNERIPINDIPELEFIQSPLYAGNQLCLMDPEEFTQVTVDEGIFGEQRRWLADGMEVTLSCLQDGSPIMGEHMHLIISGNHVHSPYHVACINGVPAMSHSTHAKPHGT